jgi:multidrug transporter EmrE-like cation transporter
MFPNRFHTAIPRIEYASAVVTGLLVLNLLFNIIANASFRISAHSPAWRGILFWQIIGNLAGFITVITLTGLLRYMPLSIAFPLSTGLSIIGVQLAAAKYMFHEPITLANWAGSLLIAIGIFLVQR